MSGVIYLQNPPDGSVITAKIAGANVTPDKLSQPYTKGGSVNLGGISYDFTSIPSWVTEIEIDLSGVGFNASSTILLQIGDSGGISNSGYLGGYSVQAASPLFGNHPNGLLIYTTFTGIRFVANVSLKRNGFTNTWVMASNGFFESSAVGQVAASSKTLANPLDRIRLTSVAGTASFDSGVASISWQ